MKNNWLPYAMLSPFLVLIVLFYAAPVVLTVIMSFTGMDHNMEWDFTGLTNFQRILDDPNLWQLIGNTFMYVGFTLVINVCFGLVLAMLTTYFNRNEKAGTFFRLIWMLPRISPPVVYVLLWLWLFDASGYGFVNAVLGSWTGAEPTAWLVDYAMVIVIIVNGLVGASFGMLIFSSAIQSIPQDLFKAAEVDGATERSIFSDLIFPSIKWPIMFVSVWQLLSLLTSYEYILLLTDGGPMFDSEVWALYSYHRAFSNMDFGYGSALALILVAAAFFFTAIMLKFFGFNKMMQAPTIDEN